MKTLLLYSAVLLSLSARTTAWPWPRWLPELDALVARQIDGANFASPSATATQTPATPTGSESVAVTSDVFSSGSASGSVTRSATSGSEASTTHQSSSTVFDARLPAGGVSMVTPGVFSGQQYFKIGDFVTFAWNYTSLLATPTAVNIMATCTANQQLYTLAANQTVTNSTGAVTWDTGSYESTAVSDPLLTEIYTLIIYDAASSISATAQAGYLAVYDQYTFGMYTPQPYTPLSEFKCATCSAAFSDMERRALGAVVGMSIITVLSFTWFVGGLGVIW